MSAKFVYSLSDENPDLHKQIGCMNGFFQLFDRHHFLVGRRIDSPKHKRLPPPPPPPPGQNSKQGTKPKVVSATVQEVQENNMKTKKKSVKDKQRFSFESPRTSLSSSTTCSSSFSSADCSKASQLDRSSMSQTTFSETPRPEIANCKSNASLQSSQNSFDLRNAVKESIYREANALSIKTATKVDAGQQQQQRTFTHVDSPRPLQSLKPAKTRNSNLNESSHVLPKLQDAPRMSNEGTHARRFSYDGRGSQDALKIKLKDLPRLSLDSRESSIKGSMDGTKSNFLPKELQGSSQPKEPGSYNEQSSIVAKLMGLEALPNPMLTDGNQCRPINTSQDFKDDPLSYSSRVYENKKNWISGSPRSSKTEPNSPHLTNTSLKKSAATKCPIEPAPWKQQDGSKGQMSPSKCREPQMKAANLSLTVYGEIEKRLAELEFKKSGKDLRALKQILEAMQKPRLMLETSNEDEASKFASHTNITIALSPQPPNLRKLQNSNAVSATAKGSGSPTRLKTPISVIKQEKVMENGSNCTSPVVTTGRLRRLRSISPADNRNETVDKNKDLTPRANHPRDPSSRLHLMDKSTARALRFNSKEASPTARENPKLAMSSETACLKLQKKKLELEKQSPCTSPASDRSRSRRQPSRLQSAPGSPHRKLRPKSHSRQKSDDQLSDIISDMRDLSQQGEASSMQSESNMSAASYGDIEVTSADRSQKHQNRPNITPPRSSKGDSTEEPPRTTPEQPSPVSVLDATFYGDESPSPVKKRSNAFKDDEGLIPDEADWSSTGLNHLFSCVETNLRLKTDYTKADNIQHSVQKVMNLDSIRERSMINEIAPVCNSPNTDHKYIVEVLLASGLLNELDSSFMAYHHQSSDHVIDPNLFASLEKTKGSIRLLDGKHNGRKIRQLELIEKNHRHLIFDSVDEILVRKLEREASYKKCLSPVEYRRRKREQLVRDLCSEIDKIQTEANISIDDGDDCLNNILWGELTLGSTDWTEHRSEVPLIVLDVERMIFKDLICESISGETQVQPGGHCRRLSLK